MTPKFNEDKAFANDRNKNHPRGRDMPHFEIRQILMGNPEVFTNLMFIQVPTLPFELCPTNSIRNDSQYSHPEDTFTTGVPMQQHRMQMNLSDEQFMSESQCATYRNHDGITSKYDMISIYSLRPPELLGVFRNPVDYFRYCHIEEKQTKKENVVASLHTDVFHCSWIDCLSRRVRIRNLAIDEVLKMIQNNITEIRNIESPSDEQLFAHEVNEAIIEMIHVYRTPENELNMNETSWEQDVSEFFYSDKTDNLPVPVVSGISPENSQQFLTHIILSLGKYNTEIDALTHPTIRDSLREVGQNRNFYCHGKKNI